MFHIAAPFYTKELRQLIKQLKAEGRLNERPLWELDKRFLIAVGPFLLFAVLVDWTYEMAATFLMLILLAMYAFFYRVISHVVIPYTCNVKEKAMIVSNVNLTSQGGYNLIRRTWSFNVSLKNDPKQKIYKIGMIPKKYLDKGDFQLGQSIQILKNPYKKDVYQVDIKKAHEFWSLKD